MFRLPPDPGNPDAQAKGLAPQRASAAPSRGAGSFFDPKQPFSIVQNRNLHRPETPAIYGLTALFDPQALRDAGIGEEGFPAGEL